MFSKIAKLPLPVKGRKIISSQSSDGIPNILKIGESRLLKKSVKPLVRKRVVAIKIVAIKGKMSIVS